ncbi:MAG: glycosyltransferase family 4 protein [Planctomycetota bacterium]
MGDSLPSMAEGAPDHVVLVANARMPSERAQSIQIAHAARGFVRAGARTTLLHARRRGTPTTDAPALYRALAAGEVDDRELPELVAAPCIDAIDLVPRALQFTPARIQEWTFGRSAAALVRDRYRDALVLARDVEVAARLAGRPGVAWEAHRVPGGRHRRVLSQRFAAAGGAAVAISGGVRDDLAGVGFAAGRVLVEHDAHDPGLTAAVPARDAACAALGLDAGRPVIAYCGSLLAWKGVEVLVDAARLPVLDGVQVLVVGGMAADVARLREYARGADGVRIDGFQSAAVVAQALGAADATVVPNRRTPRISSHYTSPLKLFEAFGAGVPVVASDLPSLREAAGDGAALFVEPEDAGALAAGLRRVLDDAALRDSLATAGRARAAGATWDARAARILDFLRAERARSADGAAHAG